MTFLSDYHTTLHLLHSLVTAANTQESPKYAALRAICEEIEPLVKSSRCAVFSMTYDPGWSREYRLLHSYLYHLNEIAPRLGVDSECGRLIKILE